MIVCGMVWLPVHVVRDPIGPKQLFRFRCKAEGAPAHSRVPDPGCRRAPLRNPLMPHFQQTGCRGPSPLQKQKSIPSTSAAPALALWASAQRLYDVFEHGLEHFGGEAARIGVVAGAVVAIRQ